LPVVSVILSTAQARTVVVPTAKTRESAALAPVSRLPNSSTCPERRWTSNQAGPVTPLAVWAMILVKLSISVRYSERSAP